MEPMPRLLWSEGLFLTPQHLQQQDRVHAAAVAAVWREALPFRWGIARLEMREDALARGLVDVTAVTAITRDGVFVKAGGDGGTNARIRSVPLGGTVIGSAILHLCLAREQPDIPTVATAAELERGERLARRHVAEEREVADADDPRQPDRILVSRLPFLLQLAVVPEGPAGEAALRALKQDFDTLPIARILPKGEGHALDADFLPPALSIGAIPRLLHRVASLADRLMGRIAEIEPELGTRRLQAEPGVPPTITIFLILRSLHEHASALLQSAEMKETHPAELYHRLRQAVADFAAFHPSVSLRGEVAAMGDQPARPALPPYVHDDLGWRLRAAIETLDMLTEGLDSGAQLSVELLHQPPNTWHADIKPEFFDGRISRFFLRVESTMLPSEVEGRLRQRKISCKRENATLIHSNLLGLRIHLLADPPRGLPSRAGRYTYFEVETDDDYWTQIRRSRDIAIFCPELAEREVRIRLFRELSPD
ncbi:MAG: type VI secretion system baseplate subunit TssK [Roseomonas sp.]|nr:type VI secretion system baseplate subunit TssK [Roseomonas sp.]